MAASYPNTVPSFTTKRDQIDVNWAADVNRLQDEIEAIAAELGQLPKGEHVHVRARLEHLQSSKSDVGHAHDDRYVRKNLATSKGTLISGTADQNFGTVAPGSNGQVLTADSDQGTGVRWRLLAHSELTGLSSGNPHPQYALQSVFDAYQGHTHGQYLPISSHTKAAHDSMGISHGSLTGREATNAHPQYPRKEADETITGSWEFTALPTINGRRVVSGGDGTTRIFVRSTTPAGEGVANGDLWFVP